MLLSRTHSINSSWNHVIVLSIYPHKIPTSNWSNFTYVKWIFLSPNLIKNSHETRLKIMQKSTNQYNIILSGHTLKRLSPKEREL